MSIQASIKLTIMGTGTGRCALTNKEEVEGLTVAFENEPPTFICWKAFRQLLSYKTAHGRTEPKIPGAAPVGNGAK